MEKNNTDIAKKNNHLLPRMVIKRWQEQDGKIFIKEEDKIRYIKILDFSKEYYYSLGKIDDELENRICLFETYVGRLFKELNKANGRIHLSEKDMEILKLYVFLQSCRNDNTSPYIVQDESGFYQNNNYLFGVPLVYTQEEAVRMTSKICDEFDRLNKLDSNSKFSYNFHIFDPSGNNSRYCWGLHLVIVSNSDNQFLISETTSIIECTMDGDYLYAYVPISPKIGLILAKSKYFCDKEQIEKTKIRFGEKYCCPPDPYLSEALQDQKLVFNGTIENGGVTLNIVELSKDEIWKLNSVIYEDGHNILFSNKDSLNDSKQANPARRIELSWH